jgi:hypothetical protein
MSTKVLNTLRKPLFAIAILGLILSALAHASALYGIDVTKSFPAVWGLHFGIFVVWLPSILILKEKQQLLQLDNKPSFNPFTGFAKLKILLKDSPSWMQGVCVVLMFYASFNFFRTEIFHIDAPLARESRNILQNHTDTVRIFSGHWLFFYFIAATILYPFKSSNTNPSPGKWM